MPRCRVFCGASLLFCKAYLLWGDCDKGKRMISLLIAFAVLVVGYCIYSRVAEKAFGVDGRLTPAVAS